ncbi:hypothetical protein IWW50_002354 [Coemansia erecta]|nr:hypothetical protein GGF43_002848 [Coemansia sp. RSA 2618]KAJ2826445.1 hypothetical protein IWW50_002354 [Coemansia erecta]
MDEHSIEHQKANEMLLKALDVVAEYQSIRETSNSGLKHGYFNLAVAKRAAGYWWISPDLYSGRARAIATVAIDETSGSMRCVRRSPNAKSAEKTEAPEGLQRRGKTKAANADKEKNSENKTKDMSGNPLLWFGMLVPPALKDAQAQFTSTLDQLVQLANLKCQLADMLDKRS